MPDGASVPAAGAAGTAGAATPDVAAIADPEFIKIIQLLKAFDAYLSDHGTKQPAETDTPRDRPDGARFFSYYYDPKGRRPSAEEWAQITATRSAAFYNRSPELVRDFQRKQPLYWIKRMPVWLLWCAIAAFVAATAGNGLVSEYSQSAGAAATMVGYLMWTLSLGALGATAYLAVNALGLDTANPFDVTDMNTVVIRIVVGGVFGFIIALAVSLPAFLGLCQRAWDMATHLTKAAAPAAAGASAPSVDSDVWKVLLPFVLGFSTSLVLSILNRFIVVIETFFGVQRRT